MREEIFRMERVTYLDRDIVYLEDFNLQIFKGEIMGMLTVNAHGLSAMLALIQGNLPLYDGYIYLGGKQVNSWKFSDKGQNRISIIGVQSRLVDDLSVMDNIFVLRQGFRQTLIRYKMLRKQLLPFLEEMEIHISADNRVSTLSVFERVLVELLRAIVLEHKLIVLNDISMSISEAELEKLHRILLVYADRGFSFLYICPHFEEISKICDRAAILSNGRIQSIISGENMEKEIPRLYSEDYLSMVKDYRMQERSVEKPVKKMSVSLLDGAGNCILDFSVKTGECLAIRMTENDSFQMLHNCLMEEKRSNWKLYIDGQPGSVLKDKRIAVVREYATKSMIFPELDFLDNLCMCLSRRMPDIWAKKKILENIKTECAEVFEENVFDKPANEWSEMQKYWLIYNRALLQKPELVICIQPFMGADRIHRIYIWKMIEQLLEQKIAVVILSLNLSDSLALADRLMIINGEGGGKEFARENFDAIPGDVPWKNIS